MSQGQGLRYRRRDNPRRKQALMMTLGLSRASGHTLVVSSKSLPTVVPELVDPVCIQYCSARTSGKTYYRSAVNAISAMWQVVDFLVYLQHKAGNKGVAEALWE
jgi:hypothetical protein